MASPVTSTSKGEAGPMMGAQLTRYTLISIILLGIAVTPLWIGFLLWLAYRLARELAG